MTNRSKPERFIQEIEKISGGTVTAWQDGDLVIAKFHEGKTRSEYILATSVIEQSILSPEYLAFDIIQKLREGV